MSRMILLTLVAVLVAGAGSAGEVAWFDMDNCSMCTNLSQNKDLVMNITWEQHPISDGIVSVTTVTAEHLADYRKAHEGMNLTAMKLQKGEEMELCGSCIALNACMMKGPKMEYVETSNGDVMILSSDNAELAAELWAWAKRNTEEKAKMKKEKG
jgi:hypothetical protein